MSEASMVPSNVIDFAAKRRARQYEREGEFVCIDPLEWKLTFKTGENELVFDPDDFATWITKWTRWRREELRSDYVNRHLPFVRELVFCCWQEWKESRRLDAEKIRLLHQMGDGQWWFPEGPPWNESEPTGKRELRDQDKWKLESWIKLLTDGERRHVKELFHAYECRRLKSVSEPWNAAYCRCSRAHILSAAGGAR